MIKLENSIIPLLKERIFEDSMDPILIEDLTGAVLDMNREAELAYGFKKEELIGKPIKTIVPESRYDQADDLLKRCLAGEKVRNVEGIRQNAQGEPIPVLLTLSLLQDSNGSPKGVASFAKDISALRRTQDQLEQVNAQLESRVRERTADLEVALTELSSANERLAQDLRLAEERAGEKTREHRALFLGDSIAVKALQALVDQYSQIEDTVLLVGPRGAGEEGVAHAIHAASPRRLRPFVYLDCSRFSEEQESSLFDFDEGNPADGKVHLADMGTLYLENVESLPTVVQWHLRTLLQDLAKARAAGERPAPDTRVIAYARKELDELSAQGRFDGVLANLLNSTRLSVPALSERRQDIVIIAEELLRYYAQSFGKVVDGFSDKAKERILSYSWPGNLEELSAVVERAVIVGKGTVVDTSDIQAITGPRLGDYNLIEKLGEGGMGEVWLASHELLTRKAAVKFIREEMLNRSDVDKDEVMSRFEREAKVTAMLTSPHTVQLYDFGISASGGLYYVMEYLNGQDLRKIVDNFGPMDPRRVLHFVEQAAYSLAEAHEAGLIHRDIKPSNIFACHLGPYSDFTKIIDFGVVRRYAKNATRITQPHLFPGTPEFCAPEMVTNPQNVGPASDLYSLGCMAYYLLTGEIPFDGESPWDIMMKHVNGAPSPPSLCFSTVPEWADELVLSLIAKSPEDRLSNARDLISHTQRLSQENPWSTGDARAWWDRYFKQ